MKVYHQNHHLKDHHCQEILPHCQWLWSTSFVISSWACSSDLPSLSSSQVAFMAFFLFFLLKGHAFFKCPGFLHSNHVTSSFPFLSFEVIPLRYFFEDLPFEILIEVVSFLEPHYFLYLFMSRAMSSNSLSLSSSSSYSSFCWIEEFRAIVFFFLSSSSSLSWSLIMISWVMSEQKLFKRKFREIPYFPNGHHLALVCFWQTP